MDILYEKLQKIKKRPEIHLSEISLKLLKTYIDGYVSCKQDIDGKFDYQFYEGFQLFIQKRYTIISDQNWSDIIRFYSISDKEAFYVFYDLLDEFLLKEEKYE